MDCQIGLALYVVPLGECPYFCTQALAPPLMIQRIQTLLLAIIALSMAGVPFTTLYVKADPAAEQVATLDCLHLTVTTAGQVTHSAGTWYLAALAGVVALLATFRIISYNDRKRQLVIGFANTLLIGDFIASTFYITGMQIENLVPTKVLGERQVGFYLPLLAILLNFSANRLIRRDETLVRSMDRLR